MSKWKFCAESPSFIVEITGGSVRILDKSSGNLIKTFKGYTYLYTGGIRPDETEFFALENGKHFYVYSLRDFELIKRVTLPRTYESINVRGYYSDDGRILFIPAERYVYDDPDTYQGHYEYVLCQYETTHYTLVKKIGMPEKMYLWQDIKAWLTEKGF